MSKNWKIILGVSAAVVLGGVAAVILRKDKAETSVLEETDVLEPEASEEDVKSEEVESSDNTTEEKEEI